MICMLLIFQNLVSLDNHLHFQLDVGLALPNLRGAPPTKPQWEVVLVPDLWMRDLVESQKRRIMPCRICSVNVCKP